MLSLDTISRLLGMVWRGSFCSVIVWALDPGVLPQFRVLTLFMDILS